jgi:hypothetical protein
MKTIQKRLNQLYEQQAIEEKKVIQALQNTLENLNPLMSFKNVMNEVISGEKDDSFYSKNAFTYLVNKTVDGFIKKPDIINQTLKVLLKNKFIDVIYSATEKNTSSPIKENKNEPCYPNEE